MPSSSQRKHKKSLEVSSGSIFIEVGKARKSSQTQRGTSLSKLGNTPLTLPPPAKPIFWNKWKDLHLPSLAEITTIIGWLVAITVCTSYIVYSSFQFIVSRNNPTTATSYVESVPMYYPAITICNWNALLECDYCNLTLKYATKVNSEKGIVEEYDVIYEMTSIQQNGQLFNCFVFNNRSESRIEANEIGYAGTLTFYFQVPPVPESRDARFGLQVSFHENGTIPSVFSETNYAISGFDNYFSLTKVLTKRLKPTKEQGLVSVRWHSLLSIVELTNSGSDVVVISVAYSTLNLNIITEVHTTSFESLFGQIAGIIGIL